MIVILSPAKKLNFEKQDITKQYTLPVFKNLANELMKILGEKSKHELMDLMGISDNLAQLNYERNKKWDSNINSKGGKQAILTFYGEVYNGLKAWELDDKKLMFAQGHIRILSGLYGVLKPLDLINAYRLEMGTKLETPKGRDLYTFWGNLILENLESSFFPNKEKIIINLASNEYAKSALLKKISGKVITPIFKEQRGNKYQTITIYAKKARGLMTRFIIDNEITTPDYLKAFDAEGYFFNEELSTSKDWVFVR